jgi:hypothetical protein
MTLLQTLMNEFAAPGTTSAHSVAGGAQGSLFAGGVIRRKKKKKLSDAYRLDPTELNKSIPKSNNQWHIIGEMMDSNLKGQSEESSFDPADVMSKLRSAEKQVNDEEDTVPFGLEDEDGNIVKVYVKADQADEFETALAEMLASTEDDDDDDELSDETEIAEVLFKLKDKFDIIDVKWPEIEGDEEEEQEMAPEGGEGEMGPGGAEMGGEESMDMEGGAGAEMDGEGEMDMEGGDEEMDMEAEGGAESTLQQVIDMMKADADARKC